MIPVEESAIYMSEVLMDENVSTYKMYEDLVSAYLHGNEIFRAGLDRAVVLMTNKSLAEITAELLSRSDSKPANDIDESCMMR